MEREEIIKDIQRFVGGQREYAERMADWVIVDRKRICEPIFKYKNDVKSWGRRGWGLDAHCLSDEAIDESLKLAGLDK